MNKRSRPVIATPGHVKGMAKALEENVKKYKSQFREIRETDVPHNEIAFREKPKARKEEK